MEDLSKMEKMEKKLIKIILILGVVAVVGIVLLIYFSLEEKKEGADTVENATQASTNEGLDDSTTWLPDNCKLNQAVPDFSFTTEDGKKKTLSDFKGKVTIVTFWASWCQDCHQQMPLLNDYLELTKTYGGINYLLIDKLDYDKESKEKAKDYLSNEKIAIDTYYDENLEAYKQLGIHNIPTTLFIDEEGILRAWCPKQITDINVFEAYLKNVTEGSGKATENFVVNCLMDQEGGIHSGYAKTPDKTYESDVLSESQGIMLEYAERTNNQEMFEKVLSYVETKMRKSGLAAWTITAGAAGNTNALIDDFRIYQALAEANMLWGGYDSKLTEYQAALGQYAVKDGHYVDFYDTKSKTAAGRFTLCYADFKTMEMLSQSDELFQAPLLEAKDIVNNGMISKEFPVFYSYYDYTTKTYPESELNMAEAMVTFLHLAEVDLLPAESLNWLKNQMNAEGVKARYTTDGKVAEGYNYDSTAVYAIIAMIAEETDEMELQGKALSKMEKMRINNVSDEYNGAFGLEDGSEIYSFDQLMPMMAYDYTK